MSGDPAQYVPQLGFRVDLTELCGADERIHCRSSFATVIGACEQSIFPAKGHRSFILPMSGKKLRSVIAGTRFSDAGFVCSTARSVAAVAFCMSSWNPV